jgi:hypothetical protein
VAAGGPSGGGRRATAGEPSGFCMGVFDQGFYRRLLRSVDGVFFDQGRGREGGPGKGADGGGVSAAVAGIHLVCRERESSIRGQGLIWFEWAICK